MYVCIYIYIQNTYVYKIYIHKYVCIIYIGILYNHKKSEILHFNIDGPRRHS